MDNNESIESISKVVEKLTDSTSRMVCLVNSLIDLMLVKGLITNEEIDNSFNKEFAKYKQMQQAAQIEYEKNIENFIIKYMLANPPQIKS